MDHSLATPKGNIVFTRIPVQEDSPDAVGNSILFESKSPSLSIKARQFKLEGCHIYYYIVQPKETVELMIHPQSTKLRCIFTENEPLELITDTFTEEINLPIPQKQFIANYGSLLPIKLILKQGKQYRWYKVHFEEELAHLAAPKQPFASYLHQGRHEGKLIGPITPTPATYRYLNAVTKPELSSTIVNKAVLDVNLFHSIIQQAYGKQSKLNNSIAQKMDAAEVYIQKHFRNSPTIGSIARHVQMSDSSFNTYFKLFFAVSATIYINELKMQLAATLIRAKEMTLQQISAYLGYKSEKGFRKSFVKYYGILPKAFL